MHPRRIVGIHPNSLFAAPLFNMVGQKMSLEKDLGNNKSWSPAFYLVAGAYGNGQSVLARYLIERSRELGRPFYPVDFTRTASGLRAVYPECRVPNELDRTVPAGFLFSRINEMKKSGLSTLVECEVGARGLQDFFSDERFRRKLETTGISLIVVFLAGDEIQDRSMARELNRMLALKTSVPTALVEVISARLLPSHRRPLPGQPVRALHQDLHAIVPSRVAVMPLCHTVQKFDGLPGSYRKTAQGAQALEGMQLAHWERTMITGWLDTLDRSFAGVVPFED